MLNCQSLTNKLSQFQSFVYSSDFTIFYLTETWLSGHVSDGEIFSNDFVIYRNDRPSRGGGVLIAVKSHVDSSRLPSPPDIEVVSVKIGVDHDFVSVQFISHQVHLHVTYHLQFCISQVLFLVLIGIFL